VVQGGEAIRPVVDEEEAVEIVVGPDINTYKKDEKEKRKESIRPYLVSEFLGFAFFFVFFVFLFEYGYSLFEMTAGEP